MGLPCAAMETPLRIFDNVEAGGGISLPCAAMETFSQTIGNVEAGGGIVNFGCEVDESAESIGSASEPVGDVIEIPVGRVDKDPYEGFECRRLLRMAQLARRAMSPVP